MIPVDDLSSAIVDHKHALWFIIKGHCWWMVRRLFQYIHSHFPSTLLLKKASFCFTQPLEEILHDLGPVAIVFEFGKIRAKGRDFAWEIPAFGVVNHTVLWPKVRTFLRFKHIKVDFVLYVHWRFLGLGDYQRTRLVYSLLHQFIQSVDGQSRREIISVNIQAGELLS